MAQILLAKLAILGRCLADSFRMHKTSFQTAEVVDSYYTCRWLNEPAAEAWNVVIVAPYDLDTVTCPHCLFVHRYNSTQKLGRYQHLYQLMQTGMWDDLVVDKHKYLYFPEEGVIQDVSAIST